MGDVQGHAPHGVGANGGPQGGDGYGQWLQKGLDGADARIQKLLKSKNDPSLKDTWTGDSIDKDINDQLQQRQWYLDEAKRTGHMLDEKDPTVNTIRAILIKVLASLVGSGLVICGGFLVSRAMSSGELVADSAPGVGTVVEPVKSQDSGPSVAQSDPEGPQVVDGPTIVIVEPVGTDESETQTTTSTEVTYEETEPVHEDSMQTSDDEPMYEEPADEGQYDDSEDGGYDEDESDCC